MQLAPYVPHQASPIEDADQLAAAWLLSYSGSTRRAYASDIRHWASWLNSHGLQPLDVHRVHVDAYHQALETAGLSPATRKRRLAALSGYYAYACDEGLIEQNPATRVRRPRVTDESPTLGLDRTQLAALLDIAESDGPRSHALVTLMGLCGLRVSEAIRLDISDLGEQRGHRTVNVTRKGGKVQTLPLPPRAVLAITELQNGRAEGPLFSTRTGGRLDARSARRIVSRLAKGGDIAGISPHSLRHTWVTLALDAGASLRDVQDGAGHASPVTTRRYDRARGALDRNPSNLVATHVAEA